MKTGAWTIGELNKLLHLLKNRTPFLVVAELIGRPTRSCYYQAARLRKQGRLGKAVPRRARKQGRLGGAVPRRAWTAPEEQELCRLFAAGVSFRQIARGLVRSESTVRRAAFRLGLYTKPHERNPMHGGGGTRSGPEARLAWSPHQDLLLLDWVERRTAGLRGGRRPRHDSTVAECERRWRDLLAQGATPQTIRGAAQAAALPSSSASPPAPPSHEPSTPGC